MSDESRVYQRLNTLKFYATHIHPCSYLPQREAVTLFVDPAAAMDSQTYSALARLGFRRSGEHLYRPHCPRCQACIPVRPMEWCGQGYANAEPAIWVRPAFRYAFPFAISNRTAVSSVPGDATGTST